MPSKTELPPEVEEQLRKLTVELTGQVTSFLDEYIDEDEEEIHDLIMIGLRQGALIMNAHWRKRIETLSEKLKGDAALTKNFL